MNNDVEEAIIALWKHLDHPADIPAVYLVLKELYQAGRETGFIEGHANGSSGD